MRKQCKRKVWQLINPIQHAIEGASFAPEEMNNKLRMRELSSLDAFTHGKAGIQEWSDLCAMLNLCETMARNKVGPEALPACELAQTALMEAAKRYERTHKMGLNGSGLQAIRDVYEFHDLQRQSVSRGQYEQFIRITRDRMRSGAPEAKDVSEYA